MKLNIFNARSFIPPEGIAASAELIIVNEFPDFHEAQNGRILDGVVGRVLQNSMATANLIRGRTYITNVIKDIDKPIAARFHAKSGQFLEEGQQYIQLLKQELEQVNCKFIVALGELALNALTSRTGITKWRGSVLESTLVPGRYVIPILHPKSTIPPLNQFLNKHLISFDFQRAAKWIELGEYRPDEYQLVINPSYNDIIRYLTFLKTQKMVSFDIEVMNEEVSCVSFSHNDTFTMSVPFCNERGDMWSPDQELDIWLIIAEILQDPKVTKLGQNLTFDAHFLLRQYGITVRPIQDSMVAQQIINPDFPKGLDFITSVFTDLPYHKDEGKKWFKVGGSFEQLWTYNATDSIVPSISFPQQMQQIHNQGNFETYERQRSIIEPLVFMQERGVRADIEGINQRYSDMQDEIETLGQKLNDIAGMPLNPNSPKQLKEYFYNIRRYPKYKTKGKVTTDNNALKRLVRKGSKEAKVIQNIRKLKKLSSTYLHSSKFDSDGRIRCSYNPVGTRYSRISSSENIFGTGMNLQNWPHELLWYLMADDYYVGYALDLSQAENRIVAYVGNIANMIHAFENGTDVHSLTAGLIFDEDPEIIKAEDKAKILCKTLGDGTHTKRFWGKKANHGLNYDLGFRTFAFYYEIPERDAKFIVEKYHSAYPGVRQTFHKYVRTQLHKNRMIENLMGRKTLFLGDLNDATFKEAYACIPQGTVGDVINERGMNFIYYNQDLFKPVELLMQVHDEIVFQIPTPNHPTNPVSWEEHAQILTLIKNSLEIPLNINGREFVIPVDTTIFRRLKNGQDISSSQVNGNLVDTAELIKNTWNSVDWATGYKEYQPSVPMCEAA